MAERVGAPAWIRDLVFGLLTGASTAAFDIAGPLFLPLGLVTIAGHGLAGLWTREVLVLATLALPMMLVGYVLGPRLRARIQSRFSEHAGQRMLLAVILGLGVYELLATS